MIFSLQGGGFAVNISGRDRIGAPSYLQQIKWQLELLRSCPWGSELLQPISGGTLITQGEK